MVPPYKYTSARVTTHGRFCQGFARSRTSRSARRRSTSTKSLPEMLRPLFIMSRTSSRVTASGCLFLGAGYAAYQGGGAAAAAALSVEAILCRTGAAMNRRSQILELEKILKVFLGEELQSGLIIVFGSTYLKRPVGPLRSLLWRLVP